MGGGGKTEAEINGAVRNNSRCMFLGFQCDVFLRNHHVLC